VVSEQCIPSRLIKEKLTLLGCPLIPHGSHSLLREAAIPIRILIVDDEPAVRAALRGALEAEGFIVSEVGTVATMLDRLDREPDIGLITLDLLLGDEDGLKLARQVREMRNLPIIMITARAEPIDRVTGLEHGADDYIVKPFHVREVLMRVRSVLRRYELEARLPDVGRDNTTGHERYRLEVGVLDVRSRSMTASDGTATDLTDAEFDILVLFVRNPGRVMTRDEMTMLLKGRQWSPTERAIDGHIARLRKKIEPDIAAPRLIKTVWRVGYVFTGDVQRIE